MKKTTIVRGVLLVLVAISLGWLFMQESPEGMTEAEHHHSSPEAVAATIPASVPEAPEAIPTVGGSSNCGDDKPCSVTAPLPDRVIVYYFHTTYRCSTCFAMEQYTQEAVEKGFAKELGEGRLEFKVINIDEPASSHFINDYRLTTKSVVVVKIKKNKQADWKNLDKIWDLVQDKPKFIKYIQDEVKAYLRGK